MPDLLRSHAARVAAVALGLAASAGCWDDGVPPGRAVDGMVILGGAPLDRGSIHFETKSDGPEKSIHVGVEISKGQFFVTTEDGLVPGHYKVAIYSVAGDPAAAPAGKSAADDPGLVPAQYNSESTLTAEIKPRGFNSLTFVLKK